MREEIEVYIERLDPNIQLPTYANITDAGMDIRASEDVLIYPLKTKIIKTGLKFAIPEGYEIQVRPRSGISVNTPLRISNSPGTIDTGYRGELGIIMTNTSTHDGMVGTRCISRPPYTLEEKGNLQGIYLINKGDRIAQIILQRVPSIKFIEVENIKDIGIDRNGGFGSSGVI